MDMEDSFGLRDIKPRRITIPGKRKGSENAKPVISRQFEEFHKEADRKYGPEVIKRRERLLRKIDALQEEVDDFATLIKWFVVSEQVLE